MNTVYFSIGSNIGDKKNNLRNAIKLLKKNNINIIKISSVYKTEPVGVKNQPYFYNICIKAKTRLDPENLLKLIKIIEKKIGRKKVKKWGPRIIDIDILFFNNIILNKRKLKIPHPEIIKRNFVLIPLYEINKNIYHPVEKKTIKNIIKSLKLKEKVIKIGDFDE
ncbi:MAG: 2-amino-4-hydroxy-6-hydroxymethyldihydropteridine diphosphokinase [Candidatus Goldbacteria bacterium]|nr:2-amino-4-hydroxy-6-hydroxymethyldihydropteridine diphosphokinase [Candidatus Goldiibacteriota bacterium]